jgi:DNA replication protein DnaD
MMADVRKMKGLVHELVDKGVTTVEEIHQSIAQGSRKGLEAIAPKDVKPLVEPAKDIHDTATHAVYETIRMVNRKVNEISDEVLAKVEEASRKVAETYRETADPWKSEEA